MESQIKPVKNLKVPLRSVMHQMMLDSDVISEDFIVGRLYCDKANNIVDAFRIGHQYALERIDEMLKHNKLDALEIEYNV